MNINEERRAKKIDLDVVGVQQAAEIKGSTTSHLPFGGPQEIRWAFGPSDADPEALEWKPLGATIIPDSIEWDKPQG